MPCTASEKEDSWLSDEPESSPGVPITDSEKTVKEIEEKEEQDAEDKTKKQRQTMSSQNNKEFQWVYVVRWHYSNAIWKIFNSEEKARKWVEENSNHNIYWSAWDVE